VIIFIHVINVLVFVMKKQRGSFEKGDEFVAGFPKKKGKAITLQVWTGAEGSRRLRLPDFKTIGT
jgi:hypothetical protein